MRRDQRKDPEGIPREGFEEQRINLAALDVTFCIEQLAGKWIDFNMAIERKIKWQMV
jgi:hypothetical protein